MPDLELRILHLIDVPTAIPLLASWFIAEWEPWYGPGGGGDAYADLYACNRQDQLPLCLVALAAGDRIVGTVSLKKESVGSDNCTGPWLAAFLVDPEYRCRGIGTALVAETEDMARRLGFSGVSVSTDSAGEIFARRNWNPVGDAQSLRGPVSVYRLLFSTNPEAVQ